MLYSMWLVQEEHTYPWGRLSSGGAWTSLVPAATPWGGVRAQEAAAPPGAGCPVLSAGL